MADYLCCKCFTEYDDSEGKCPLCEFQVCRGDCNECNRNLAKKRYLMAQIMLEENPFIQNKGDQL